MSKLMESLAKRIEGELTPLREVGWTDEARAAAQAAKAQGYKLKAKGPDGARLYTHHLGHALMVEPSGHWSHMGVTHRSTSSGGMADSDASGLKQHLNMVHNPKDPRNSGGLYKRQGDGQASSAL